MPGDELASKTAVDPGQVLASTREALGVTQREVSDALNLPITTVDAIERGDKSRLPPHVFTRGYVRAYAKLLEIDPDPLVAALVANQGEEKNSPLLDMQPKKSLIPADFDPQILLQPKWLAAAGAVLLLLILLIWLLFSSGDADPPQVQDGPQQTAASETVSPTDATTSEGELNVQAPTANAVELDTVDGMVADSVSEAEAVVQEAAETSLALDRPSTVQGETSSQTQSPSGAESLVAVVDDIRRLTPTGDDRLSLTFTEDCWVEIKDAQGNTLFGDLGRVGQDLEFVGAAPYRVLLGYAPGVLLKFNAEPIALSPHTRNNVASLVLGQ